MNNHWIKRSDSSKLMVRLSLKGNGLMTTAKPLEEEMVWIVPLCVGYTFQFTGYQLLRLTERKKNGFFVYNADKEIELMQTPLKLKRGDEVTLEFDGEECIYFDWKAM